MKNPRTPALAAVALLMVLLVSGAATASYRDEALPALQRRVAVAGVDLIATYASPELEWLEARDMVASDEQATELLRASWEAKTSITVTVRLDLSALQPTALDWSAVRLAIESGEETPPLAYSTYGLPSMVRSGQQVSADLAFPYTPIGAGNPPQALRLSLHSFIASGRETTLDWVLPLDLPRAAKIGVFEADVYAVRSGGEGSESGGEQSFDCH